MYVIIEFYILVSIMLLLFNLFFIFVKNTRIQRLDPFRNKAQQTLGVAFELYTPQSRLNEEAIDFLNQDIHVTRNLLILETAMEKRRLYREELKEEIKPYVFKVMDRYKRKGKTEKAYYAYFLTLFDYEIGEASANNYGALLSFLESRHFYVFSNTMNALYTFKDPYILIEAIRKVDERSGFYHSQLLTDGLLRFDGDLKVFRELILKEFYTYQPLTQVSLLNYCRLKGLPVEDLCLEILHDQQADDEVIYAAMRYFSGHPNEQAKALFMEIIAEDSSFWIEQLLAIQGLQSYGAPEVRELVKEKVNSQNWNVRNNAVNYLYRHEMQKDEILELLALKDQYTSETLYYYYEQNEEVAPYILENLQEIKREKNEQSTI